ncbi:MAG: BlaI/MecI/CopY family transcriptional regulator [Prevotella sp.]|nr:BlaI/MecI/CopY family transcriptional regulator [Prevotella sp.]
MKPKRQLTKGESQLMNILWDLPGQKGTSPEIMSKYPTPKPALTTMLTFLKILTDKGFVSATKVGRGHIFKALVSRAEYTAFYMGEVQKNFFGGSVPSLVSYFVNNNKLSQQEIDELLEIIKNKQQL